MKLSAGYGNLPVELKTCRSGCEYCVSVAICGYGYVCPYIFLFSLFLEFDYVPVSSCPTQSPWVTDEFI